MKINPLNYQKAVNLYKSQSKIGKKDECKSDTMLKKDELILSDQAQSFQIALKAAQEGSDIRQAKVQAIKASIQNGSYKVDSDQLAEKIIQEALFNKKA